MEDGKTLLLLGYLDLYKSIQVNSEKKPHNRMRLEYTKTKEKCKQFVQYGGYFVASPLIFHDPSKAVPFSSTFFTRFR